MRRAALAISLLAIGSISASAADMRMRTKAPPIAVAPVYSWTGFYVGGNIGYGWGNADTFFNPLPSAAQFVNLLPQTLSPNPSGVLGGVQAGYNWQAGRFVIGVETDIQGADIKGDVRVSPIIQNNNTPFPSGFLSAHQELDWLGTTRLRAGFTPVDRLLLYVTGGVAYGDVSDAATTDFRPVGTTQYLAAFRHTKTGWTAGGGGEWAFAQNWSAKIEYLYIDLGNDFATVNAIPLLPPFQVAYTWKTQEQLVRFGVNYKFGASPVVAKY